MPSTELDFSIPSPLSDKMCEMGVKHLTYERKPGNDSQFDRMVNGYCVHVYRENAPYTSNVLNIDQTSVYVMRATHVIHLFQNDETGKQIGSIFLRYNNLHVYKINTPPFFTILLVVVNPEMRRQGYGSILMKLAYELSKEIASKNPIISQELSEEYNCKFHLVPFVPIADDR